MTRIPPAAQPLSPFEERVHAWAAACTAPPRYAHTTGVVKTVTRLARCYAPDALPHLRLAAWIHDAAKTYPDDELLHLAAGFGYKIRKVEQQCPQLLHGAVAALLAKSELGLDNPLIFSASAYHTTGHPQMSLTDKLLFVADAIEPGRQFPWVRQARALVRHDLDQALLFVLTKQLQRLIKRTTIVDPRSIRLRNRLLADGVALVL